jgi:hypothetical protein
MNHGVWTFMNQRLRTENLKIFELFYPVEAEDLDKRNSDVVRLAFEKKCSLVLNMSVYQMSHGVLSIDIEVIALAFKTDNANLLLSAVFTDRLYSRKMKYDSTGDFSDKFVFSEYGKKLAEEMLDSNIGERE